MYGTYLYKLYIIWYKIYISIKSKETEAINQSFVENLLWNLQLPPQLPRPNQWTI